MRITSPEPYWLLKNGITNSYPSLQQEEQCDVLVVGGGITGALMAHALLAKGYDTILVDKRHVCTGSTSATTAMLQYEIDVPLHKLIKKIGKEKAELAYRSCAKAIYKLCELCIEIDADCGFAFKKSLYIAKHKQDVAMLQKELAARLAAGFEVAWVEEEALWNGYGITSAGGILSQCGASVDAYKLAHELLAYNIKKGLRVYDHTSVVKTNNQDTFSTCTTSNGYTIKATKVVFCTGYESTNVIGNSLVSLLSTYACISETHTKLPLAMYNTLVWDTGIAYTYMRTTEDGRLLIGGGDLPFNNTTLRDKLIDIKKENLIEKLHKILPNVGYQPDFCWAGTFGTTKDGLPYVGYHPEYKNCIFVLGFGGNGITFSVSAMDIVTHLLAEEPHPLADLFSFER